MISLESVGVVVVAWSITSPLAAAMRRLSSALAARLTRESE